MIKGMHHIAFKCNGPEKLEEVISFYTEILGLKVFKRWGEGIGASVMIDTGDVLLEIFASGTGEETAGIIFHYALATDDVDGCVERVRAAGYPVTREPGDIDVPAEPENLKARIAFVRGAAGEEIEFFCVK